MKKIYVMAVLAGVLIFSCVHEESYTSLDVDLDNALKSIAPTGNSDYYILPESNDFDKIPGQDPVNKLNKAKVELGNMLFFETGVGLDGKHTEGARSYSCASCHIPSAGFRPGAKQGIADGGIGFGRNGEERKLFRDYYKADEIDAQGIRALSVMNVAFVKNTLWSGQFGGKYFNEGTESVWGKFDPGTEINKLGFEAMEGQNIEGLKVHRMRYDVSTVFSLDYKKHFDEAFPEIPVTERYSPKMASFALSAYLRTLFSNQAPFQMWLKGNKQAMADNEKRGAVLFFGKAGCARCHKEQNLGSMEFHALGVWDLVDAGGLKTSTSDLKNLGRGGFTGKNADMFKFRVPQLYNLKEGSFYFHGSSKKTMQEVVEYFNNGVPENSRVDKSRISPYFTPLNLSESEIKDLTAFLENGLHDPHLDRYKPKRVLSGNCFPNNDPISRVDLDCK